MRQIEECVLLSDGIIFGGYVRDKIIHDHYATEFYNVESSNDKYEDITYHPETKLRTHLPNDIDCFIPHNNIPKFKELMKKKMLHISDKGTKPAKIYFTDIKDNLEHTRLTVQFKMNRVVRSIMFEQNLMTEVEIDVIHSPDNSVTDPPFGTIDFECNSLLITSDNEYRMSKAMSSKYKTPKSKLEKFNNIIADIIQMKTKIVYFNTPYFRVVHMQKKNWQISSTNIQLVKNIAEEDNCLICMKEIESSTLHSKFTCCNGRMCISCIRALIEREFESCPMCRSDKYIEDDDKSLVGVK